MLKRSWRDEEAWQGARELKTDKSFPPKENTGVTFRSGIDLQDPGKEGGLGTWQQHKRGQTVGTGTRRAVEMGSEDQHESIRIRWTAKYLQQSPLA